jgi:hypothetical protein
MLALAALMSTATADEPEQRKVHRLKGVVVSKIDGKPVADATVAMAHARKGYIFVDNESTISVWGADEKVLFFLPKRNGKTACETRTDQQGCFTLKSFTSLTAKYSIVAGSKDAGLAILEGVCPKDHAEKPLRIEIDEPAYLSIPKLPKPKDETLKTSVQVSLAPEVVEASKNDDKDAVMPRHNVYLGVYMRPDDGQKLRRAGPLVGGKKYRVSHSAWAKRLGTSARLFETVVAAEAGKTVPVEFKSEGGTTLSGRITTRERSPLRDVNVIVRIGENNKLLLGTLTDAQGNYTIPHAPAGTHQLELLRHAVRVGPG